MKYSMLGCSIHLFKCHYLKQAHFLNVSQKNMKIDQLEGGLSTFEVPGSKLNVLLPGTSSGH